MDINYADYARFKDQLTTGINTRINSSLRISSIYRKYTTYEGEQWAWETLLWDGDNIIQQFGTLHNADSVVSLHCTIKESIYNERFGGDKE